MKFLYAPWRENYIKNEDSSLASCPFCLEASTEHDHEKYIIQRYSHVYLMLNLYPYNPGHALVIPFEHCDQVHKLSPQAQHEFIEVTARATKVLQEALGSSGMNMGMNIGGHAAGGTIPEHIHMHVLPRFEGDTNFLPILAETKQVSRDLNALYKKLVDAFRATTQ